VKDRQLRFIGGAIGSSIGRTHIVASRMDSRWNLSSSYFSRDPIKNQTSHQHYHIPFATEFSSIDDFLQQTVCDTDIYVILTPSPDHFEIMSKISSAGGNFLCEKSVVCDLEQAKKLRETLLGKTGTYLSVHNFSGYPMIREMRHLIQEGVIGKILHLDSEFLVDTFIQNPQGDSMPLWRKDDRSIPCLLLDLGPHLHHFSDFLVPSKISTVHSKLKSLHNSLGIVDYAEISGDYDCGAVYSFRMSRTHAGNKANIRVDIYGSEGSIGWQHGNPDELQIYKKNQGHLRLTRENIGSESDRWSRGKPGNCSGYLESFANIYCDISEILDVGFSPSSHILPIESAIQGIEFLAKSAV